MEDFETILTPLELAEAEAKSFAWRLYESLLIYQLISEDRQIVKTQLQDLRHLRVGIGRLGDLDHHAARG